MRRSRIGQEPRDQGWAGREERRCWRSVPGRTLPRRPRRSPPPGRQDRLPSLPWLPPHRPGVAIVVTACRAPSSTSRMTVIIPEYALGYQEIPAKLPVMTTLAHGPPKAETGRKTAPTGAVIQARPPGRLLCRRRSPASRSAPGPLQPSNADESIATCVGPARLRPPPASGYARGCQWR